jgi:hypothetical protein
MSKTRSSKKRTRRALLRAELLRQLKEKDEEIARLNKDNRLLKMLADNLDRGLKKYRAKPFVEDRGKLYSY